MPSSCRSRLPRGRDRSSCGGCLGCTRACAGSPDSVGAERTKTDRHRSRRGAKHARTKRPVAVLVETGDHQEWGWGEKSSLSLARNFRMIARSQCMQPVVGGCASVLASHGLRGACNASGVFAFNAQLLSQHHEMWAVFQCGGGRASDSPRRRAQLYTNGTMPVNLHVSGAFFVGERLATNPRTAWTLTKLDRLSRLTASARVNRD